MVIKLENSTGLSEGGKLFQNRKHEKAVRKNGRTDSVSTAACAYGNTGKRQRTGKRILSNLVCRQMRHHGISYAKGYARVCRSWNLHICISKERLAKFGLIPWKTTTPKRLLHVKLIEPPYTRTVTYGGVERSEGEIIAFLLLDYFIGKHRLRRSLK